MAMVREDMVAGYDRFGAVERPERIGDA